MEAVFKVSASIRALRAQYLKGPLERHAPVVYVVCRAPSTATILASQTDTIAALAKSSKSPPVAALRMVPDGCAAPRGCATEVLDAMTEVHVMLKGVVDFSKEVARLQKELGAVQGRHEKLRAKMAMESYADKCPPSQQAEDATKLAEMAGEMGVLSNTIKQFEAGQE